MLSVLLGLMFKMLFPGALAYILFRRGVLSPADRRSLTTVLLNVAVVFTILMSSQQEFTAESRRILLVAAIFSILYFVILIPAILFFGKRLGLPDVRRRVFVCLSIWTNCTYVGYPVMSELFGNVGLLCIVIYSMVSNCFYYTWGVSYLGVVGHGGWKSALLNKFSVATVIALALYFLQIRIPEPIYSTFDMISRVTTPLAMIIIGCNLAEAGIKEVVSSTEVYLPAALRMAIIPMMAYVIMRIIGLDREIIGICTMIACMPCGTMTPILAVESGMEPHYATNTMILSTLMMTVLIPFWAMFVRL